MFTLLTYKNMLQYNKPLLVNKTDIIPIQYYTITKIESKQYMEQRDLAIAMAVYILRLGL